MSSDTSQFGAVAKINLKACNMAAEWKSWKEQFKIYLTASKLDGESDERKVALMLHHMGSESFHVFKSFDKDISSLKFEDLVKLFDDYFIPKVNLAIERHNFFTRKQNGGETIHDYVTTLKNLSQTCDFGPLRDDLIKDIFICGMSSNFQHVKERLLSEGNIKLDKAVTIAQSIEAARENANQLDGLGLNMLQRRIKDSTQKNFEQKSSKKYGQVHKNKCPAENVICHNCHRKGHYVKMCLNKEQQQGGAYSNSYNQQQQKNGANFNSHNYQKQHQHKGRKYIRHLSDNISNEELFIGTLSFSQKKEQQQHNKRLNSQLQMKISRHANLQTFNLNGQQHKQYTLLERKMFNNSSDKNMEVCLIDEEQQKHQNGWDIETLINNKNVEFQIDTGADANILSLQAAESLGLTSPIQPTKTSIYTFSGEMLPINVPGKRSQRAERKQPPNLWMTTSEKEDDNVQLLGAHFLVSAFDN